MLFPHIIFSLNLPPPINGEKLGDFGSQTNNLAQKRNIFKLSTDNMGC